MLRWMSSWANWNSAHQMKIYTAHLKEHLKSSHQSAQESVCQKCTSKIHLKMHLNPIYHHHRLLESVSPMLGGVSKTPPRKSIILDPIFLKGMCYWVHLDVTCKTLEQNLKNLARFQDFNILWNCDFALHWQAKNGHNSLDFEDRGLKFCMLAYFW